MKRLAVLLLICVAGCSGQQEGKPNRKPKREFADTMAMKTFLATHPKTAQTFLVAAELSSYFNFDYADAKETHYSVRMVNQDNKARMNGFVLRSSGMGKQVYEALSDGKQHWIILTVQASGRDASCAEIVGVEKY